MDSTYLRFFLFFCWQNSFILSAKFYCAKKKRERRFANFFTFLDCCERDLDSISIVHRGNRAGWHTKLISDSFGEFDPLRTLA